MATVLKSVRLDAELARRLKLLVEKTGRSQSALIQEAIRQYCENHQPAQQPSLYELDKDLFEGAGEGPEDLSTNPKYLQEALEAKARRWRKFTDKYQAEKRKRNAKSGQRRSG